MTEGISDNPLKHFLLRLRVQLLLSVSRALGTLPALLPSFPVTLELWSRQRVDSGKIIELCHRADMSSILAQLSMTLRLCVLTCLFTMWLKKKK